MEKEVVRLFEAAKKSADVAASDDVSASGPEVARCLDALKCLQDFPVSYDILVSTQIGKRLRTLTKHPQERIQRVASDLMVVWKQIVIDETARKKNGTIDDKSSVKSEGSKPDVVNVEKVRTNSVKLQKPSGTETFKVEKKVQEETVKVERISKEQSNVKAPPKLTSLVKCNDAVRDKIRELLVEALSKVANEADEDIRDQVRACDPIRVAVSVESMMYEKMGQSNGAQKLKYRSIMFNIRDSKNPDFRRKVLLGQVKPENIVTMTPEEMASDERQRENNQIKEKALFECERGGPAKATTDQFKCGRCGQRKCTYYQMQTRSADEPMTTYVTCVNCNNRWKFC